jgi:hypothetical protein
MVVIAARRLGLVASDAVARVDALGDRSSPSSSTKKARACRTYPSFRSTR